MDRDRDGVGQALGGGLSNAGAVFRRGGVVVRPAPAAARALHAHLRALRAQGFTGAPEPVRLLGGGREELEFVPGDIALPPFPARLFGDGAVRSLGGLLRRLHEAGAAVPLDASAPWSRELADPEGGPVLCHNDACPENVVLRDGRAAALIDFDMAAPGRAVWDVAMTARYWVPMLDPVSAAIAHPAGLADAPARLRILADGYGLSGADRAALPAVVEQATAVCRGFVARRIAAGEPAFVRAHEARGGWTRWDRIAGWLASRRPDFEAALAAR